MASEPELISLFFSPWSLKAKWVLRYCRVSFRNTEKPALETPLRWRLGIPATEVVSEESDGKLTVPILALMGGALLRQSLAIAKWANEHAAPGRGVGASIQGEWHADINYWDAKGTRLMNFGRFTFMGLMLRDDASCIEFVSLLGFPIPGDWLKLKLGRAWGSDFMAKYSKESEACSLEETARILDELQAHLQRQQAPYILGEAFSYADISMVLGLHCLRPYKEYLPMGPLAAVMGKGLEGLAAKYEPLFAWGARMLRMHLPDDLSMTSTSKL